MRTNTTTPMEQHTTTGTVRKALGNKVMRIAQMTKQLLDEIHEQPLDNAALGRLKNVDANVVSELRAILRPELSHELQRLARPISGSSELSEVELRLAHAQLVGWLQGLLRATANDPHTVLPDAGVTLEDATNVPISIDIPSRTDSFDPHLEARSRKACNRNQFAADEGESAIRSARQTIVDAIVKRIAYKRLDAARAAALLRLDGPKVTKLIQANADEFTLDELVTMLPALELAIHVTAAPHANCAFDR